MIATGALQTRPPAVPPPAFRVGLTERFGWRLHRAGAWRLWLKGGMEGARERDLVRLIGTLPAALDLPLAGRFVATLPGNFALVAERPGVLLAAVDRIRSIPLIYSHRGGVLYVDQDGSRLQTALGLGPHDVDPDAALSVALAGYTIGNDTLYRSVRQLGPGEFLLARADGSVELGRHHRYEPYHPVPRSRAALKREFNALIGETFERLVASADGRPIAVPLSAGYDSRLVASGLKSLGYRDVFCFAYGLPDNRDAVASRLVADRLGYPWRFVPFSRRLMQAVFASADYAAYRASCDSLTGVHFPQDYLALVTLRREGFLPADAIIVNGQSGDFISGNHVPLALATPRRDLDAGTRRERVVEALLIKHFKQWASLATPASLLRIRTMLLREIEAIGGMPADAGGDHGVYEWCEFQDRQSKYVVNGQRLYEYLGHDWRLPLWDASWLDFWARVPVEAKLHQNLYREALLEADMGGVWRGIPINASTIRPNWVALLRHVLKPLHLPLGRARWHDFERRYLQYWMDNLCCGALRPYLEVARDGRGPRSGVAYHIEDYLQAKGLALEGLTA